MAKQASKFAVHEWTMTVLSMVFSLRHWDALIAWQHSLNTPTNDQCYKELKTGKTLAFYSLAERFISTPPLYILRISVRRSICIVIRDYLDENQLITSRTRKSKTVGNHVLVEATLGIVGLSVIAFAIIGSVVSLRCVMVRSAHGGGRWCLFEV